MDNKTAISHDGTIIEISDVLIRVSIFQNSACSTCHARNACGASETKEKIIEIPFDPNKYSNHKIGDQVTVIIEQTLGFKALFIGYLVPFILIIMTVITGLSISKEEGPVGLAALAVTSIYYFILFLLRKKIKKMFTFRLK